MSFVIGLTGGVGSGKTAAAEHFAALGAAIIDTDVISRELTAAGGGGIAPIRSAFGEQMLTAEGALDRGAMRRLAFADPAARARLEGILHPLIQSECEHRMHQVAGSGVCYVVLVVPLLIEVGGYRQCIDRLCVVDCPEETQIVRVMARNHLGRREVMAILAAQATRAERLAAADDVIDNSDGLPELIEQVEQLHRQYCAIATNHQLSPRTP